MKTIQTIYEEEMTKVPLNQECLSLSCDKNAVEELNGQYYCRKHYELLIGPDKYEPEQLTEMVAHWIEIRRYSIPTRFIGHNEWQTFDNLEKYFESEDIGTILKAFETKQTTDDYTFLKL